MIQDTAFYVKYLWDFLDFFVKGVLNSKDEDYSFFAGPAPSRRRRRLETRTQNLLFPKQQVAGRMFLLPFPLLMAQA